MPQHNILGHWYAVPQGVDEAQHIFTQATHRMEQRLRHSGGTLCCRLQLMQAKFWLGNEINDDYLSLQRLAARSIRGRALLELVYGQLLLSRQLSDAVEHLDRGFDLARNLFTATDYFSVMNRHRQLKHLPLAKQPSPPLSLEQLLVTAQVIERLEQPEKRRSSYTFDNRDTYG